MRLVILAAGHGQRFKNAGFEMPKPLIQIGEMPIIEHTLSFAERQLPPFPLENIIVISTPIVTEFIKDKYDGHVQTVTVNRIQPGPAASALLCGGEVKLDDGPIIMMDSDVLMEDLNTILQTVNRTFAMRSFIKGVMVITKKPGVNRTQFSTVGIEFDDSPSESNPLVVKIAEKKDIGSDYVGTGIYAFKNWKTFADAAVTEATKQRTYVTGRELYMSSVMQNILNQRNPVQAVIIPEALWTPVGSPRQLLEAMEKMENGND